MTPVPSRLFRVLPTPHPALWLASLLLGAAVAVLPLPLAVLACVAVLGLLVIPNPAAGLCLLAVAIPFGLVYQLPLLGSQLGLPEVLLGATLLLWLLDSLAFRRHPLRPDNLSLALAVFAWVVGLSLLASASFLDGLAEVIKWAEVWLLYLVARALLTDRWRAALIAAIVGASAAQGLLGLYQFVMAAGPEAFRIGRFLRAYGTFAQPNPYAGYLGLVAPLALSLTLWAAHRGWQQRDGRYALLSASLGAATGLVIGGVVASWSRGALLGVVASSIVVVTMRSKRAALAFTAAAIAAAMAWSTGIGADAMRPFVARFTDSLAYIGTDIRTVELTDANFAVIERAAHWQAGMEMFAAHPWLGVGAGNYPAAYPQYALPRWDDPLGHAHNIYINTAAEMGISGLLALLLVLWGAFVAAWSAYRQHRGYAKAVALGVLGILVHLTVHSLFDSLFVQRLYLHLALVLALLHATTNHSEPVILDA